MANFLGAPYPIVRHPKGLLRTQGDVAQIKADLLQLLLTNPGERVFLPDFGTPLRTLVFDPNDAALADQAKKMITDSVKKWEPRIAVMAIDVTTDVTPDMLEEGDPLVDIGNILFIRIAFVDPNDIQSIQELRLELPLAGGTS